MATFTSQASNLSALRSSLCSYSHAFDTSQEYVDRLTDDENRANAHRFLEEQSSRAESIDNSLLNATEYILPESGDIKTVTELAELCRLVQEATRQKMSLVRTRLELLGVKTPWDDHLESPLHRLNGASEADMHWSVGCPLESVQEGDVETEGATTPGSLLQPSPFASATKSKPLSTPTTPTMDNFSFSASTTSILEKMNLSQHPSSDSKRRSSTMGSKRHSQSPATGRRRSDNQVNFVGFTDDDDMITLNTLESRSSTGNTKCTTPNSPATVLKEERSQFLARMESMLERVEEELIHETRPTDERSSSTQNESATRRRSRPSNSKFLEELDKHDEDADENGEEAHSIDDDSTNVVATQVASVDKPRKDRFDDGQPKSLGQANSLNPQNLKKPVPVFHRPTHIVLDSGMPSPAHTNITMDATMLNDTFISHSLAPDDDDNLSIITPVLDRYRLDADDNSIGIKVVPNKRGTHTRGIRAVGDYVEPIHELVPTLHPEYTADNEGFMSPRGLPGSVSARKKKQYRKTPFPKKQLDDSFQSSGDENDNPNIQVQFSPKNTFSISPLRPRSFGPTRTMPLAQQSSARTLSLPSGGLPKTPRGKGLTQQHPKQPGTIGKWMEKITMAEYHMAPKVVQMQVQREEANLAIDTLEEYLTTSNQTNLEFTEKQGINLLSENALSEQKSKSILISLCHWRRLAMHRESDRGIVFAVNQFAQ